MARKVRIHRDGALYYVLIVGNGDNHVFFSNRDVADFLALLREATERFGCCIHAYTCMRNSVDLAIQVDRVPLNRIMHNISFRYTQLVNRRYRRSGHLFRGRYCADMVDSERDLLSLVRHIHLKPLQEGKVRRLDTYRWSSHRIYVGKDTAPWVTSYWVLSHFCDCPARAVDEYVRFMASESTDSVQSFLERIRSSELPESRPGGGAVKLEPWAQLVCGKYRIELEELLSSSKKRLHAEVRGVLAWMVAETGYCSLSSVAQYLKRDPSTMSVAVRRVREQAEKSIAFRLFLEGVQKDGKSLLGEQAPGSEPKRRVSISFQNRAGGDSHFSTSG